MQYFFTVVFGLILFSCSFFRGEHTFTYVNQSSDSSWTTTGIYFVETNYMDNFQITTNELLDLVLTHSNILSKPVLSGESIVFTYQDGFYLVIFQYSNQELMYAYAMWNSDISWKSNIE